MHVFSKSLFTIFPLPENAMFLAAKLRLALGVPIRIGTPRVPTRFSLKNLHFQSGYREMLNRL